MSEPCRQASLHDFFLRQANRRPNASAIECDGKCLSYAELEARSTQLAYGLVPRLTGANDLVALCLPRGIDAYVAILGVLRAGAAYVPIDVETPDDRALFMIDDCKAQLVLTTPDLAGRFNRAAIPCLPLAEIENKALSCELPRAAPEDLCYVIYTSGTTGKPKGVCISHRNAVAYLRATLAVTRVREDDRVHQGFSLAFDASVEQIWMALGSGATLVAAPQTARGGEWESMMKLMDELPVRLRSLRITVFSWVPTMLAKLDPGGLPELRLLIFGGEAVHPEMVARWAAPGRRLLNTYGPTEATVVATYKWLEPDLPVTIGKPLPGYEVMVEMTRLSIWPRRKGGKPRPEYDVEGELCIGGPGVSLRGYLNQEKLNNEKFFEHRGLRFYRTGDLVRFDEHGDLLFRGRIDTQVKIRGYRIELEEIERKIVEALREMDAHGFQEIIVGVHEDPDGSKHLDAYLVPGAAAPRQLSVRRLIDALRQSLPDYMVPAPNRFFVLPEAGVPRMTSGKLDREGLSPKGLDLLDTGATRPGEGAHDPARAPKEGKDILESSILQVWRDLLGTRAMGCDDSYFDFGAESLHVANALARLRDMSGGKPVSSEPGEFQKQLGAIKANTPVEVVVLRRGKREAIRGLSLPEEAAPAGGSGAAADDSGRLGARLEPPDEALVLHLHLPPGQGQVVRTVAAHSAAARAGLKPGDILLEVGGVIPELPELARVSSRDLYECKTAEALAGRLQARALRRVNSHSTDEVQKVRLMRPVPRAQFLAVAVAQAFVLLAAVSVGGFLAFGMLCGTYLLYDALAEATPYWPWLLAAALPLLALLLPVCTLALGVGVKRLLVGRFHESQHPVWSWGYFRWWLAKLLLSPVHRLAGTFLGTPLAPFLYRLLGARIGKRVYLGTALEEPDLVTIEDDASVADMAALRTHSLRDGMLRLRPVHVGKGAFVGCRGMVCGGARLGERARLHPQSCLVEGTVAAPGTEWRGSPARQVEPGSTALSALLDRHETEATVRDAWDSRLDRVRIGLLQLAHVWVLALVGLVPLAIEMLLFLALDINPFDSVSFCLAVLLPAALPFAALRFAGGLGAILACKWLLTGRARPGTVRLNSSAFVRRWFCGRLMALLVHPGGYRPLTETLLMPVYCRWLGMRVGRGVEISDAMGLQPDLVSLGHGAMLADGAALGAPIIHRGRMTLGHVSIGNRSFLGNGSQVPLTTPGLGNNSLLGVASLAPDAPPTDTDWLGSPPVRLPNRKHWSAPDGRTFHPPGHLVALRWLFGGLKMVLPGAVPEMIFWTTWKLALLIDLALGLSGLLALVPALAVGFVLAMHVVPVVFKWVLIGRYRPGQHYLWSLWMWRHELVLEMDALPSLLVGPLVDGTPWRRLYYRAMGARLGRQVCLHHANLFECDLLTIGDHVTMEGILQTHLFEDRVMKLGTLQVEEGVSIGSGCTVLYDTRIGAWASVGDGSLVLKHETLSPRRRYRGLPVENVQ